MFAPTWRRTKSFCMKKDDSVYLHHILDAIERIEHYLSGMELSQFLQDVLRQDGVVRQLEVIGEASRQISSSFRSQHSEIPWGQIIAMRNRIVHDYTNVDVYIVWEVARRDLPSLKQQIVQLLEGLSE